MLDQLAQFRRVEEVLAHVGPAAAGQRLEFTIHHLVHAGLQQTVLVGEVVRDEPGRDVRLAGDLRESRALDADFCETFERDLDELLTAGGVAIAARGAAGGVCGVVQGGCPRVMKWRGLDPWK